MSEPNGHYSRHPPEYSRDEYGTEHVRYSPDGPWVMLGPNNASSAQLPDFTSGSLPSFQDTFSDSLGFPRSSQMTLPPAFGDSNQASGSNYNERIRNPFASSSHGNVDPARVPLPEDREDDFPPASKLLPTVARPAAKVAGSRHSDPKGKRRADGSPAPSSSKLVKKRKVSIPEPPAPQAEKKRGRREGAGNYRSDDLDALCDILEERLPLGGKAWNSATDEFNAWARENGRPTRAAKSLEAKFKQLVKTSKPTGDAECPPHVERAHEIEDLMNEKAGSRDLDDEDIVDVDNDLESSDEENIPVKKNTAAVQPQVRGPVARCPATDRLAGSVNTGPCRRNNAQDILQNISSVLSPDAQMARSEEFSTCSMQTTQIFTLSSQNRDLQNRIDRLQSDLAAAERARNEAERCADRAEMMSMLHESSRGRRMTPPRRDNHVYQEVRYSDGGRARHPNTRRYTIHSADHDDDEASIRPSSPVFQSAASGLNHMLEMPEHSGGTDSPPTSSSSPFTSTRRSENEDKDY